MAARKGGSHILPLLRWRLGVTRQTFQSWRQKEREKGTLEKQALIHEEPLTLESRAVLQEVLQRVGRVGSKQCKEVDCGSCRLSSKSCDCVAVTLSKARKSSCVDSEC